MKYNLAKYSQTVSNIVEGDIDLTIDELINIINTTTAQVPVPASGTASGTLVLDCDLGARIHIDEVRYYFDSILPTSTAASGIKFYYKNEDFEVYVGLDTNYNENYYYTIVSGSPRYIRVEHTAVSGLGGYVNSLYVLNDDTYVDFGEQGTDTNTNFSLSLENNVIEINDLEVFNSSPVKATAKLLIEPQNTVADDILSISDSVDGPWYGVYRDADKITGSYMWSTGAMDGVVESDNALRLADDNTVGTYTTRIIKLDENQRLTFNVMSYDYPVLSPEVEFFDDFSAGGVNWQVTSSYRYSVSYTLGYMDYWNSSGADGYFYVSTKNTDYDYGEDWELTFKYIYQNHIDNGQYTYFLWPQSNFYLRNVTSSTAYLVVKGTSYNLSALKDWSAGQGVWHNVKVRRNFTSLGFKIWPTASGEPNDWMWEGYIQPGGVDLALTGGIQIMDKNDIQPPADHVYYDDFKLTKRFTSSPIAKTIIATEDIDTTENIEVRSSNSEPIPRESYIWMSGTYSPAYKYTNHNWIMDGGVEEQSNDWGTWGQTNNYWEYWYDSISENEYIIDKPFYTAGNTVIYFRIRKKSGTLHSTTISNATYGNDCFYSTYKVLPVSTGGFWICFFLARGNINDGIYYLRHYNSTMGQMYNREANSSQGTFLYDMDVVYDTSHLWYTDRNISTVFKINTDGTVLTSYLATQDIRGIVALVDGGCWFIQQEALMRLDTSGALIDTIELPTSTASYIYSDLDGGFWLQEGSKVYHLGPDGEEYFNITIPGLLNLTVLHSGFLTKHHDGSTTTPPKASYVSKDHQRIIRTWNYPQNEGGYVGTFDTNKYGARSQVYNDLVDDHASHFPTAADNRWDSSEWASVSLRDYNFTSEQFHQIRFTLRAAASWNSPQVYGLWTQRAVEIPNIYPDNYGKFYLKSDITYLALQDIGDYTSKIRAYWFLNTE